MNNDEIEVFDDFDIDNSMVNNQAQNVSTNQNIQTTIAPTTMPINQNIQTQFNNVNAQSSLNQSIENTEIVASTDAPQNNDVNIAAPKQAVNPQTIEKKTIDPNNVRSVFDDPIKSEPKKTIELGENPIVEMVNNKSAIKLMAIILIILFAAVFLMPLIFKTGI